MPYGPSVPHMFIVVFLIMLPIYLKTHDPVLAWQSGLAWCLVIGVIVLLGAFVGPTVRKYTPRAAMLGTLAGISIAFISMRPAFQGWEDPVAVLPVADHRAGQLDWPASACPSACRAGSPRWCSAPCSPGWRELVHLDDLMQPARGRRRLRPIRLAPALPVRPTSSRRSAISARCWSPPCRSASTISPRA